MALLSDVPTLRGEPAALAARAAVRAFFHHRDAVSVLEHAVSGLGFALIGLFALQVYYWIDAFPSAEQAPVPHWFRALCSLAVGGVIAALAWKLAYPGHHLYAALIAFVAACAMLNCDGVVRRAARVRPGWTKFGKSRQVPAVHGSIRWMAGIYSGAVSQCGCSGAAGRSKRRFCEHELQQPNSHETSRESATDALRRDDRDAARQVRECQAERRGRDRLG